MKAAIFGVVILATTSALAAPKKEPFGAKEPSRNAADLAAPPLKLTLLTGAGSWRVQVVNEGNVPVRLAADVRLVSLELTAPAPGKAKPVTVRCTLPADARPSSDTGSELVIPPARSWTATLDPFFYCFGAKERAALVPGATVKARLGWTAAGNKPPYVAVPVGAGVGKLANARVLDAAPVTLDETITPAGETTADDSSDSSVSLTVPETMDAGRGVELGTTVTLVNGGARPITVLYRPEMVMFRVVGPAGAVACGWPRQVPAPIRELYGTVGAHGKAPLGVLFSATCPAGTFDEPGLYRVTPRLDLTGASGRSVNLATWDGTAVAKKPLLLRVRSARHPEAPPKPNLD